MTCGQRRPGWRAVLGLLFLASGLGAGPGARAASGPERVTLGVHSGWIALDRGVPEEELVFRKYVVLDDGFQDLTNLHCPRGKDGDLYVSIDLAAVPALTRAEPGLAAGRGLLFVLADPPFKADRAQLPFAVSGGLVLVEREGIAQGFDAVLDKSEFRFDMTTRRDQLVLHTTDDGPDIVRTFNAPAFRARNGLKNAELISTAEALERCKAFRAAPAQ